MLSKFPHPDHWVVDDLVLSWAPVSDVKVGDMRGPLLADPSPHLYWQAVDAVVVQLLVFVACVFLAPTEIGPEVRVSHAPDEAGSMLQHAGKVAVSNEVGMHGGQPLLELSIRLKKEKENCTRLKKTNRNTCKEQIQIHKKNNSRYMKRTQRYIKSTNQHIIKTYPKQQLHSIDGIHREIAVDTDFLHFNGVTVGFIVLTKDAEEGVVLLVPLVRHL